MSNTKFEIFHTECLAKLATLPDNSVDIAIFDPPYNSTNLPFDKLKMDWKAFWTQTDRVCKPSAVKIAFAAQPFTTDLIQSNRRHFRYSMVWQKTNPVGFLSANVRPLRAHEDILVFCSKFGRVKGQMQSVYNPQFTEGTPYVHRSRSRPARHYSAIGDVGSYQNLGRRFPTSVLTYARDVKSYHPTQKPLDLLRKLVRQYSNVGDVVLDMFAGSGNTGVAALLEGRQFVGMELDAEYYAVAFHRLKEAQEGRV